MEFEAVPFAELLLRGAARHPERDCMVLPEARLTYGEVAERATDAGRALLAMGLDRGDHVGIIMANGLDYVEVLFGASLIGAVPVLYNGRFKAREIAHVTADAGVAVIVTSDIVEEHTNYVELLERAMPDADQRPDLVRLGAGTVPGFVDRQAFRALADGIDPAEVERRHGETEVADTAVMFYTSGTTAMPKGCPLDHVVLQYAGVVGGIERWWLKEGDTMWGPLPMFHTAFTQPLTGVLHLGGTYLSMTHFEPGAALAMIERERPTAMFPAFPTITKALLNHPDYRPETLASVRTVLNVGPPDVLRSMQAQMPASTTQLTAFGMTETGGSVAICEASDSLTLRSATSGRALPGNEIRVIDPDSGLDVEPGERGEIVARGRGVFSGYHNDPIKTAEAIDAGGWFHTGDLGSLDADGRVTFHGRLKDMLKVGGENVAAVEVEGYLATHPAVNLAQVVGLPDEKYEEVPVAFIELLPERTATEEEIIEFCVGEIAAFKVPRHIRFVDSWPMGATKILKYELRDRICAELGVGPS
ncbi:MAG: class I adenylate-forming enzyme family protein [Acidimicrobiales bacterium]